MEENGPPEKDLRLRHGYKASMCVESAALAEKEIVRRKVDR